MGRTISTSPRDPDDPHSTYDLDDGIAEGLEALRLRLTQALKFRLRSWFLARNRGLDYDLLIGHQISSSLAATLLNETILEEGGAEVEGLEDVDYSIDRSRRLRYSARVRTIYGDMTISEALG